MKNLFAKVMANYLADQKGLVTIEWVGIAAVIVVAGIVITAAIMGSADNLGATVDGQMNGASTLVPQAGDYGNYGTAATAP